MATKRPTVKISKDKLPKPPVVPPVVRLLEDEHRHLLSAALEGEAANERAARLKLERLILLSRIDPENRVLAFEKAVAECVDRLSKAETRHTKWMARVRERTGIQTEFTFDSESGVISEISSE
jgi:hypothetical protein